MKLIFKYYWPKEMRQLVDEYREQGILNDEAVEVANKQVKQIYWSVPFLIIVLLWVQFPLLGDGIVAVLIMIMHPLYNWRFFYWNYPAYCYGKKQKAMVTRYFDNSYRGTTSQVLKYILLDSGVAGRCLYMAKLKKEDEPKKGDIIDVYHNPKNPLHSMPDVSYIKKKYSLRTDILP